MKNLLLILSLLVISMTQPLVAQTNTTDIKYPDSINKFDANGMKTGYWIERQGELTQKGVYTTNRKSGNWITYYSNSLIFKVEYFTEGVKDGISLQFDRKGKLTLMENYRNNLLNGPTIYYGQYTESPMSETNFANGKKNGQVRQYYDNAKLQEDSHYINDQKNGYSRWFNKNGRMIAEYHYKDGNFDGLQKTFFENDSIQSTTNYTNNKMSGEYREYYRNGRVKISGKYLDGLKEGTWTEFNEIGKVEKTTKYKAGVVK